MVVELDLPPLGSVRAVLSRACPAVAHLGHAVAAISEFLDESSTWTMLRACRSAHASIALLRRICLREQHMQQPMDPFYRDWQATWGIQAAASRGDLEMVRFVATEYAPGNIVLEGVEAAAASGHLHVLKWLHDEYTGEALFGMREMWLAAENGHLEVLQWLHKHSRPSDVVSSDEISYNEGMSTGFDPIFKCRVLRRVDLLVGAGERGHLHIVEWLASEIDLWHQDHDDDKHQAEYYYQASRTAANGHLHVLKWLASADYKWLVVKKVSRRALQRSLSAGHFEVVQWLWNAQPSIFLNASLLDHAAASGRLDMLDWMLQVGLSQWSAAAIVNAARAGHLDVLRWLRGHLMWDGVVTEAMDEAAANGHLEVVQFLHSDWCSTSDGGVDCTTAAMDGAASNRHLDIVEWLHENRSEGCTVSAMDGAAAGGHLDVIQWLHTHRSEGCTTDAMDKAAAAGYLEVVRWLHANRCEGCSDNAMDEAARNGQLATVLWLYENRSEGDIDSAMDEAAAGGHLDMLLALHPYRDEGCSEWAFVGAYKKGAVDVLRWLKFTIPDMLDIPFVDYNGCPLPSEEWDPYSASKLGREFDITPQADAWLDQRLHP